MKKKTIFLAVCLVLMLSACGRVEIRETPSEPEGVAETMPDFSNAVDLFGDGKVSFQPKETTVEEPATEPPTTEVQTTKEQTTEEKTTQEPTTSEVTTEEPTTPEPTTEEPTTTEPTTPEATTEEATTEEPTTAETTTPEMTTEEPETEPLTPVKDSDKTLLSVYVNGNKLMWPYREVNVASPVAIIKAFPKSATTTVEGEGTLALQEGKNEYGLLVTAEDGSQRRYPMTITYIPPAPTHRELYHSYYDLFELYEKGADNNYLREIRIDGTRIPLNDRKLTVSWDTKEVTVTAVACDPAAKIEGLGTYPLEDGDTQIDLHVHARDGSKRRYRIRITRKEKETEPPAEPAQPAPYYEPYYEPYVEPEPETDFPENIGVIIIG